MHTYILHIDMWCAHTRPRHACRCMAVRYSYVGAHTRTRAHTPTRTHARTHPHTHTRISVRTDRLQNLAHSTPRRAHTPAPAHTHTRPHGRTFKTRTQHAQTRAHMPHRSTDRHHSLTVSHSPPSPQTGTCIGAPFWPTTSGCTTRR